MPKRTGQLSRWAYAPAALIALAGVLSLAIQWYHTRPMWVDEEMIALNLRDRPLAGLSGPLWLHQSAPFGWLALQHAVLLELGNSERVLRAVPVLFGIAVVISAAWAGRRWLGPIGAALFVLLCSFAQFISYFPLEIKQYSADVFVGVLFPFLTLWALEPDRATVGAARSLRATRVYVWWLAAAVGHWFAVAALFITPGCALILCIAAWRRAGTAAALRLALPGLLVCASFAAHYHLSLQYSLHSEALREYWSAAYPPAAAGAAGTAAWLAGRLDPLAANPGGSTWGALFWLSAAAGIGLALLRDPWLALTLATGPISAFVLSAIRLVPLADRLALWMLPSIYAALSLAANDGVVSVWRSMARRRWMPALLAGASAAAGMFVIGGIVRSGIYELSVQPRSKHALDDRTAMRYLMALREPGDALITTHMGLPAVWWYGGVNVADPNRGRTFGDGGLLLETSYHSGPGCLEAGPSPLDGRRRVLVYLGFDSRNPPGSQELVLDTLGGRGRIVAYRRVAEEGVAALFDLTRPPAPWTVIATRPGGQLLVEVTRPSGCISFEPALRW